MWGYRWASEHNIKVNEGLRNRPAQMCHRLWKEPDPAETLERLVGLNAGRRGHLFYWTARIKALRANFLIRVSVQQEKAGACTGTGTLDDVERCTSSRFGRPRRSLRPSQLLVVVTLARYGIGATTAISTLFEQRVMLRRSLWPVVRPDELWRIGDGARCCHKNGYTQDGWSFFSWEAYRFLRAGSTRRLA